MDIGAYDPVVYSNTLYFYKRGWRGINIDANPCSIKTFRKMRKRDINIESGVSNKYGELDYYVFGKTSPMNTFNKKLYDQWSKEGMQVKEIKKVPVCPINDILAKNLPSGGQHIDFITLDVEGFELEILKSFNFKKYAPDYFVVEDLDYRDKDLIEFQKSQIYFILNKNGYIVVAKTMQTFIFKKIKKPTVAA
ncbi:methyltransferase FkbM family protein [Candidatus Termititenax dinenymphae]|uniref:Methyltransferase FkbM family protein n=1 Tax=Candidatus Termititenax dinenymphae TaxID=2218523 RepID=A0A388TKC8_9BACT|nr:methyltransferase FkbM family protein [Candidatus Termititenax dinenymphae]